MTLEAGARAVRALAEASLLGVLEPLPVVRGNGAHRGVRTARVRPEAVGVASALGTRSRDTGLALAAGPALAQVAGATTRPLLRLGGEAVGDSRPVLEDLWRGLPAGPNVCGTMIGWTVLGPGDEDPRGGAAAVAAIVHDGAAVEGALGAMAAARGAAPERV